MRPGPLLEQVELALAAALAVHDEVVAARLQQQLARGVEAQASVGGVKLSSTTMVLPSSSA